MPHTHGCQIAEKMWRWRGKQGKRTKAKGKRLKAKNARSSKLIVHSKKERLGSLTAKKPSDDWPSLNRNARLHRRKKRAQDEKVKNGLRLRVQGSRLKDFWLGFPAKEG
jgi:hypothetical protein